VKSEGGGVTVTGALCAPQILLDPRSTILDPKRSCRIDDPYQFAVVRPDQLRRQLFRLVPAFKNGLQDHRFFVSIHQKNHASGVVEYRCGQCNAFTIKFANPVCYRQSFLFMQRNRARK
jgi:hypothetical protein